MRQRLLATLLHYANAGHPGQRLYDLKYYLLRTYARFDGHDLQEIRKECYGQATGYYEWEGCKGPKCSKCGGTGVFDIRWIRLERWQWCGHVFHVPSGDTRIPPDIGTVKIFGRIEHPNYGLKPSEAELWLYVLCCRWGDLWHALRGSSYCKPRWWPMLNLQWIVFRLAMKLSWKRCWCGKMFPTWGSGWQICRKCRAPKTAEEIPF